ncbi:MAG: ATP-binding protein [Thermoleophilia bacterium]|nr:ATP-binding protein [Thermoleophilia bacterium]
MTPSTGAGPPSPPRAQHRPRHPDPGGTTPPVSLPERHASPPRTGVRSGFGRRRQWAAAALGLLALAGACAALLPFRGDLSPGSIALLLLPPALLATAGGPVPGVLVALIGGLAFNVLFTEPYNSLRIEAAESVAALVVYVTVGARDARRTADVRAGEIDTLGAAAADLLRRPDPGPALDAVLTRLQAALGLRGAALALTTPGATLELGVGDEVRARAAVRPTPGPQAIRDRGLMVVPVGSSGGLHGLLAVDAGDREVDDDAARLTRGVADVIGLAAARMELDAERLARRSLEESDRLRESLIRTVSHDLRTPLAAIRAAAGALRGGAPAQEHDALLADIEGEAERLSRLVSDLLDMSRIEAGAVRPRAETVPVEELAWEGVGAAGRSLGGREVEVRVDPATPPVVCDEAIMRQVIVNLIDNACRHAPGGPLTITGGPAGAGRVAIRVVDRGPGIPPGERERALEPFVRLGGGGTGRGAGLGLAVARGLVEAQGGTLAITGTEGGGATVVATLPAGEAR